MTVACCFSPIEPLRACHAFGRGGGGGISVGRDGGAAPVAFCCCAPRVGGSSRFGGWRDAGCGRLNGGGAPMEAADSGDGLPAADCEREERWLAGDAFGVRYPGAAIASRSARCCSCTKTCTRSLSARALGKLWRQYCIPPYERHHPRCAGTCALRSRHARIYRAAACSRAQKSCGPRLPTAHTP